MIYCFDIDECLADNKIRRQGAGKEPKREAKAKYENWLAELQQPGTFRLDKPIRALCEIVHAIKKTGAIIYFVTARSEIHRDETLVWLETHNLNNRPSRVIFRKETDFRPDEEYKLEVLQTLELHYYTKPVLFDDKPKVCKLLAKNGYVTLQVRA